MTNHTLDRIFIEHHRRYKWFEACEWNTWNGFHNIMKIWYFGPFDLEIDQQKNFFSWDCFRLSRPLSLERKTLQESYFVLLRIPVKLFVSRRRWVKFAASIVCGFSFSFSTSFSGCWEWWSFASVSFSFLEAYTRLMSVCLFFRNTPITAFFHHGPMAPALLHVTRVAVY